MTEQFNQAIEKMQPLLEELQASALLTRASLQSVVLERLAETRGLPESITVDNGPEFAGKAMDEWAYRKGVKLNFIRPGKPVENAYAESFNGRLRHECLNTNWFVSVRQAREIIENWRLDYNEVRPHSSLKGKTPKESIESVAGLY